LLEYYKTWMKSLLSVGPADSSINTK
jgi:hypothetical protein